MTLLLTVEIDGGVLFSTRLKQMIQTLTTMSTNDFLGVITFSGNFF